MGAIVGGVLGGAVFIGGVVILAFMWKTGRLKECKNCCGPSDPAVVTVTQQPQPPGSSGTFASLPPAPAYPTMVGTSADKPQATTTSTTAPPPAPTPAPPAGNVVNEAPPKPDAAADPPANKTPAKGWAQHLDDDQ